VTQPGQNFFTVLNFTILHRSQTTGNLWPISCEFMSRLISIDLFWHRIISTFEDFKNSRFSSFFLTCPLDAGFKYVQLFVILFVSFCHTFPSLTEMMHDHYWFGMGLNHYIIKPLFVGIFEVS
jgi:hypothetical protein